MKLISRVHPRRLKKWLIGKFKYVETASVYEISSEPRLALTGKVALVTGGSGAIGRSICVLLASSGAKVYVGGTTSTKTEVVVQEIRRLGGRAEPCVMDMTDEADIVEQIGKVAQSEGRLDIFVGSAGGSSRGSYRGIGDMPTSQMRSILDVNLVGPMVCAREVSRHMRANKFGRIIFIGSIISDHGKAMFSEYAAAKAGINAFARSIAMELGRDNITVNCVSPGIVQRGQASLDEIERISTTNYMKDYGTAEDIGEAVLFLASEQAGFITGQNLKVDGGRSLGLKGD